MYVCMSMYMCICVCVLEVMIKMVKYSQGMRLSHNNNWLNKSPSVKTGLSIRRNGALQLEGSVNMHGVG